MALEAQPAATREGDDVTKVFRCFDSNGDGQISPDEIGSVVRALSSDDASPEEVGKMIVEMDTDGDIFVDLAEFAAFFSHHGEDGSDAQLMDAFRMYDVDGNGKISVKELHLVMRRIGEKCSLRDYAKMIHFVDADGEGNVDFSKFKRMMTDGAPLQRRKR